MSKRHAIAERFAHNVQAVLDDRGMTASGLARRTGVPMSTVYKVLRRERTPTLDTAQEIARALRFDLWQLIASDEFAPDVQPQLSERDRELNLGLLEQVVLGVEKALTSRGGAIDAEKKARLIALAYRWAISEGSAPPQQRIEDMAALAA